jgi:anti-sigma regulatory factor (Ser/Thr protein kinase)
MPEEGGVTAAPDATGYVHELLLYRSAEELLQEVVPFLCDGADAGEPAVLVADRGTVEIVLEAMPTSSGLAVVEQDRERRRPATDLRMLQSRLAAYGPEVTRVRLVNEMPPLAGARWHEWRRGEAAANVVLRPYPVWGLCAHDCRALDGPMLRDLRATHTVESSGGVRRANDAYQEPTAFLAAHLDADPDPVEATPPSTELLDPSLPAARAAVGLAARRAGLGPGEVADLVFAANEVVTNATVHGRPPVTLRLWAQASRLTVTVRDRGPGPSDPLVGLVPARPDDALGGRGIWISHQLVDVAHRRDEHGYTIRLTAGG